MILISIKIMYVSSEYGISVDKKYLPLGEIKAINVENTVRKKTGDEKRNSWFGIKIPDNRLTDDPKLRDK